MRTLRLIFCMLLLALAATACRHKDIMCPGEVDRVVDIHFEWDKAEGASPKGMTVYFFPASSHGQIWRFDIPGARGGTVQLPTGEYRMLAFNNDLPSVRFADTSSFYDLKGEALSASDSKFLASVGVLYGAAVPSVEVTPCDVRYKDDNEGYKSCPRGIVPCYPDTLTTVFNVLVRNVKGMERTRSVRAYLDGVGSGVCVCDCRVVGIPTAVTFPMSRLVEEKEMAAVAGTFADTGCGGMFSVTLVVTRTDGETLAKQFDVTDQVLNSRPARNVDIIIDGLDIPDGDVPDDPDIGGIQVGVDGWATFEIELNTGGTIVL